MFNNPPTLTRRQAVEHVQEGWAIDPKVVMYAVYLAISIGLTLWVGTTLSRAGALFLEDAFADSGLSLAVNRLLVVGFYLLNFGFVSVAMRDGATVTDTASVMERLSLKIGLVLVVLGAIHFFNLSALGRYRRSRLRQAASVPPLPPSAMLANPAPVPPRGQGGGVPHPVPGFPQPTAPAWWQPSRPAVAFADRDDDGDDQR
jgi:hypothetical protein